MNSGEALGWLFVALVNDHLREHWPPHDWPSQPPGTNSYCPRCCGPCGTLRDYWTTPRGKADAQAYLSKLSVADRDWSWAPGGVIDWEKVERRMAAGWCPNHKKEKS